MLAYIKVIQQCIPTKVKVGHLCILLKTAAENVLEIYM